MMNVNADKVMDSFSHPIHHGHPQQPSDPFLNQLSDGFSRKRHHKSVEAKDQISARKLQKADRERSRRDRLNEQFLELGIAVDPDRPKNDKATILTDAIEMLKELAAEVNRLKAEHASLSEESSDLIQEKNELRDEKTTLKSDIDNLNFQYQQRMRVVFPWAAMDPMVPVGASAIPLPAHTLIPDSCPTNTQGQVPALVQPPFMPYPLHPSLQPFPFFSSATPDISNQYFAFPPYASHVTTPQSHVERPCPQYPSVQPMPGYVVQLQPLPPNPVLNSVSQSMSGRNSSHDESENLAFQQGSNATKSLPSDSENRQSHSKCNAADLELIPGANIQTASSCQSSSSGCDSQDPDKIEEMSTGTRKTMHSVSHTRSSPARVIDKDLSGKCFPSQNPKDGLIANDVSSSHSAKTELRRTEPLMN